MRLDVYLVDTGHFKSRGRAKQAIIKGYVKINGNVTRKPAKDVLNEDNIDVTEGMDKPAGYFKLEYIQEQTGVIKEGDHILDLGSSAGGFLTFAAEIAKNVRGIEFSKDFRPELDNVSFENNNVSVIFGDVFKIPLNELSPEKVDVILSDLTLEPTDSLEALERMMPLLKDGGRLLQVIKIKNRENRKPILSQIESMGLTITDVLESKKEEIYIVASKMGTNGEK
ncbi:MAG: methyltransferase domain-containing protein [Methanosarcinaceae archaeon]|nr:methyltransferase domain-containing protein [Methanosarcinaceae archaeon]